MDQSRLDGAIATDLLIHDIRTPLAAISGYAQLLRRRTVTGTPDRASLDDGLRRIQEAATRVGHLLDELTDVSLARVEATDRGRESIDLVQLVNHIAEESQTVAAGNAQVVVLPNVAELVGWWNPVPLQRMLANVIDNALKYNRCDHPVVVSIKHVDNSAVISIADAGVGIPAAELTRVFEPGYRASNVPTHASGSGLGLAGPHRIVASFGGSFSLESQIGIGTTATVRLPLGGTTP
jgi:signal transduction histidine kinase